MTYRSRVSIKAQVIAYIVFWQVWVNKCLIECKNPGCDFMTRSVIQFRMHTLSDHSQVKSRTKSYQIQ